jgi:hypothetical protein
VVDRPIEAAISGLTNSRGDPAGPRPTLPRDAGHEAPPFSRTEMLHQPPGLGHMHGHAPSGEDPLAGHIVTLEARQLSRHELTEQLHGWASALIRAAPVARVLFPGNGGGDVGNPDLIGDPREPLLERLGAGSQYRRFFGVVLFL